jgi:hypothetical protein
MEDSILLEVTSDLIDALLRGNLLDTRQHAQTISNIIASSLRDADFVLETPTKKEVKTMLVHMVESE